MKDSGLEEKALEQEEHKVKTLNEILKDDPYPKAMTTAAVKRDAIEGI